MRQQCLFYRGTVHKNALANASVGEMTRPICAKTIVEKYAEKQWRKYEITQQSKKNTFPTFKRQFILIINANNRRKKDANSKEEGNKRQRESR